MKLEIPVPLEKLRWFQEKLGLGEQSLQALAPYRNQFIEKKKKFSQDFFQYFHDIPETRIILERGNRGNKNSLVTVWERWFEAIFNGDFSPSLLTYLWRSGLRHVEADIDQRFINLGYAYVRQFCQGVAEAELPVSDRGAVLVELNRLVDFCVLIETHAFITATSQCDMEVVKGISHQVRNPLTVIGGNILRLKRKVAPGSPLEEVYDTILVENRRLEKMVVDVGVYSDMLQREARAEECPLRALITNALERLQSESAVDLSAFLMELNPPDPVVVGDSVDLKIMFFHLLQNSLEAADPRNPRVEITSRPQATGSPFQLTEIFSAGRVPEEKELPNLFVPFYSSKPLGTGLGLPIAHLAARKSHGDLSLEPLPGEGSRYIIRLPLSQ